MKKRQRRLIYFSLWPVIILGIISCGNPYEYIEAEQKENVTIMAEVTETQEYINDPIMHIPESMSGTYGTWEISVEGIDQPVDCMLYPNPVTSKVFIDNGGSTTETVGNDYYSFYGTAKFLYKEKYYSGDCKLEIKKENDVWLVNGVAVE